MTGPIVCATRGGKACHHTQGRAIALAQENSAELIFLFVADPSFAGPTDERLEAALKDELARLGRSLLYIARERAREQGLEAQTVVRDGPVGESIEAYVQEVNASALIIGTPQAASTYRAFSDQTLDDFASAVEKATGVPVIIVD